MALAKVGAFMGSDFVKRVTPVAKDALGHLMKNKMARHGLHKLGNHLFGHKHHRHARKMIRKASGKHGKAVLASSMEIGKAMGAVTSSQADKALSMHDQFSDFNKKADLLAAKPAKLPDVVKQSVSKPDSQEFMSESRHINRRVDLDIDSPEGTSLIGNPPGGEEIEEVFANMPKNVRENPKLADNKAIWIQNRLRTQGATGPSKERLKEMKADREEHRQWVRNALNSSERKEDMESVLEELYNVRAGENEWASSSGEVVYRFKKPL